jgi:hypothetical protein
MQICSWNVNGKPPPSAREMNVRFSEGLRTNELSDLLTLDSFSI